MDKLSAVQVANMTPEEYDAWVKEINGPEEKSVNEIQTEKIVYRFNDETYEYIGEYSLQPDPVNPGKFLKPSNITEVKPLPKNSTKRIYWDPIKGEWYYKEMIHGFDWYDKSTGNKGFDVNENNVSNYVKSVPPVEGIMVYDDDIDKWVYNYEEIKSRFLMSLSSEKYKLLSSPYKSSYGEFNSINDILPIIKEYLELLSDLTVDVANIRSYSNENIEFDMDSLKDLYKELIQAREDILNKYWKLKDEVNSYDSEQLKNYLDIDGYVNSSEVKSRKTLEPFDKDNILRSIVDSLTKHN